MLTPVEIQSKTFRSGGLGYDKKDVDGFLREVLKSYENVYRENMELNDRVSVLNDGIQYYKTIEKTLQRALVLAEKTADETKNAAHKEAKRIEKEASIKANIMLADARNELEKLHQQTIILLQQYEKYKAQFKSLAAAQIDLLQTDAFQINIANLDAIITQNQAEQRNISGIDVPSFVNKEHVGPDEDTIGKKSGDDVEEITPKDDNRYRDDTEEEYDSIDFSDFNIDGQEEFEFLDLEDSEE